MDIDTWTHRFGSHKAACASASLPMAVPVHAQHFAFVAFLPRLQFFATHLKLQKPGTDRSRGRSQGQSHSRTWTTKNIVHQMWARQLGLRPGLRPDAMLSLQRGRCRCLKCTFWHAAWRTGWEGADGEGRLVSLSCWSSGKNLELHFKWIDGRREADAAAE